MSSRSFHSSEFQILVRPGSVSGKEIEPQPSWNEFGKDERGWYYSKLHESENGQVIISALNEEEQNRGEKGFAIATYSPFSVSVKNEQGKTVRITGREEDIDLAPGAVLRPGERIRPIILLQNPGDSVVLEISEFGHQVKEAKIVRLASE